MGTSDMIRLFLLFQVSFAIDCYQCNGKVTGQDDKDCRELTNIDLFTCANGETRCWSSYSILTNELIRGCSSTNLTETGCVTDNQNGMICRHDCDTDGCNTHQLDGQRIITDASGLNSNSTGMQDASIADGFSQTKLLSILLFILIL